MANLALLVDNVKTDYNDMEAARKMKCTCSGMCLQIEGCCCDKAKARDVATKRFWCDVKRLFNG